jgi:transmembrane sensor
MAHISRIARVLAKKMRATLSAQEQEELDIWLRESPDHQVFVDTRMRPDIFARGQAILWGMNEDALDQKMKKALRNSPYFGYRARRKKIARIVGWTAGSLAAATFIGVLCRNILFSTVRYSEYHTKATIAFCTNTRTVNSPRFTINDEPPILLDTVSVGSSFRTGNLVFTKAGDHYLDIHWADNVDHQQPTSANAAIFIPPGNDYWQLSFPDRSRARLDPNTSLSYYIKATGDTIQKRVIAMNGHAFFEVASNKNVPFYIETTRGETTVLGTQFDLKDYAKENSLSLSLYQGHLTICNGNTLDSLDPLHQATIETGKEIKIARNSLPAEKIVWDEGRFDFRHKNLNEAMTEIRSHYKMDTVIYLNHVDTATRGTVLDGLPEKSLNIDQLLGILDRNDLHFTRDGKTIFVRKP